MIKKYLSLIITVIVFCHFGMLSAGAAEYRYDKLNRLIQAEYGFGQKVIYTYDAAGNILAVQSTGGGKGIILAIGQPAALVDGSPYTLDAAPFIDPSAGRTLVPIRFVSEALGAQVDWLVKAQRVLIKDGTREISLTIGSREVTVDGTAMTIDCAPAIVDPGRTFVPLRFVSETLGAKVDYHAETNQITITR